MEAMVIGILVLGIVIVLMAVKQVPQGQNWTVENFGKYDRTLSSGLAFIMPFVQRIGAKMTMMESLLDVPGQEVITKDNAMVRVDGVVYFQVIDAYKAAYEVNNLQSAIQNLAMTNLRTVVGAMSLDELLSNREHINNSLLRVIDEATNPWGVKVTRVEIRDVQPPRDLIDSMARQMKAERDRRATILEADAARENAIRRAEGQKQASILEAEGAKEATIRRAEADRQAVILEAEAKKEAAFREAEARERQAAAEAASTKMVSDAIAGGNTQALNYFVAQKYVEAMKQFATSPNQKVLFMPLETSAVLSSLGGIAELLKDGVKGNLWNELPAPRGKGGSVPPVSE